jgi:glutathione peroxidase-family protein
MSKVYDPKTHRFNVAGFLVTGFVKDSFITIEPMEKEQIKSQVGKNGETNFSVDHDERHKITINLMGDSPANAKFSLLEKAKGVPFPVFLDSKDEGKVGASVECYVMERSTYESGAQFKDKTWVLIAAKFIGAFK